MLNDLNDLEHQVVTKARRGEKTTPTASMDVADLAVTDDPGLRVRAELIRELLLGRHGVLDPRGVHVQGVRVVGRLDLDHLIAVTRLTLTRCALPDGITCQHARLRNMNLNNSLVTGIQADGLHTDSNLSLHDTILTATSTHGAVQLLGAHIGGQLDLEYATITNTNGPTLNADRLHTDSSVFLRNATLTGTSERGAVRLGNAHIGGTLALEHTIITNTTTGPALHADNVRTDGGMFLQKATCLTGTGELGALRLHGAHIGGDLDMRQVKQLSNSSGPLLELVEAKIAGTLFFPASVVCPAECTEVSRRGCCHSSRQIKVNRLVFANLSHVSGREWLHLLVHHTPGYWSQPFQHLAAVEHAAGHDNNARHILITQQDHLRRKAPDDKRRRDALGGPLGYARHWLWGWLGRYGYRAHRLVTALTIVLVLAAGLGLVAGHITTHPGHHAAERIPAPTVTAATPGTPCSPIELIGLGIDRGLPLGATGVRSRCDLDTTTTWGQRITATLWILQALVWALATLTIAAYTSLIRKPN